MKKTFVATTVYHLYLIVMLIEKDRLNHIKSDNLLIIIKHSEGLEKIINNLLVNSYFRKVVFLPNKREQKNKLGTLNYLLNRKKLINILDSECIGLKKEEKFISESKIYIADIDSSKNYFYLKYRNKKFSIIEGGSLTYVLIPSRFKIFKKRFFRNGFIENGFDNNVEEVYALNPTKLPKVLAKKGVKIDIEKISSKFSKDMINTIFNIFNFNTSLDDNKKRALIVTQNIFTEGYVNTELEKINIYKEIISGVPKEYTIFIKAHPREKTDYTQYFNNATVFPREFPAELFLMLGKNTFDLGYTLFSTSLDNLGSCVKNKKFVALDYLDLFLKNKNQIKEVMKLYNK